MAPRSLFIDGLKVLASQLIVLHHIVLYAPMADVLSVWPTVQDFLAGEARYMVQVFLVIGGFLAAQSLPRQRATLGRLLWARYLRLVPMLAFALLAVLAASALLPPGRWPDWVTPWPSVAQFLAHLLLLQDVLGIPSLSAGVWYVAIDFQLYALLALATVLCRRSGRPDRPAWQGPLPWAVAALALASLAVFNRDDALDVWAIYFFAAYGLGALTAWAGHSRRCALLAAALGGLMLAAAAFDGRPRLALTALTALGLWWVARPAPRPLRQGWLAAWLARGSDASYALFLIHYAVIVATTALWLRVEPQGPVAAWAALLGCWAAAMVAGSLLQRAVGVPLSRFPARAAGGRFPHV